MVLAAEKGRLPELLPLRHGRMVRSAFTFHRGSALPMAADLASTPSSGVFVQCCGDAHLSHFGGFATPERRIIYSINDLDETLPAPWEWDVKRLASSFVVACRDNGLKDATAWDVATTCSRRGHRGLLDGVRGPEREGPRCARARCPQRAGQGRVRGGPEKDLREAFAHGTTLARNTLDAAVAAPSSCK